MRYELEVLLLASGLFVGMLLCLELGRRLAARRSSRSMGDGEGVGAVDAAVFGLLGLLIAFCFSGASVRFDARRQMIVDEANDIRAAYGQIDLLPAESQPALRDAFRRYVDARIEVYRRLPDVAGAKEALATATAIHGDIWRLSVALTSVVPRTDLAIFLASVGATARDATTRTMAARMHPPAVIFAMLFGLALVSSVLAGYRMTGGKLQNQLHMLGFALATTVTVYVILDLEYPRLGLIRVDDFDQALADARADMNR